MTNQLDKYNKIIDWAIRDALKRWGDLYEPIFSKHPRNLQKVVKLVLKSEAKN